MRNSTLNQVLALRQAAATVVAQADALLASVHEEEAGEPTPTGCQHPESSRLDTTTGGGSKPSFFCQSCKKTSDEIKAESLEGGS